MSKWYATSLLSMRMIKISNDDFHEPHDDDDFDFTSPMLMNLHVLITVQPMVTG